MTHNSGFQFGYALERITTPTASVETARYKIWQASMRLIAAIALLCLLPLFSVIWLLQKCNDRGPFLFKQTRPGYGGQTFSIYKIRTMRIGAETATALGTKNTSPQVTQLGRILRKLKIDETPQLFNVVRGDMTLVGPRPIPVALDQELSNNINGFQQRYNSKPGLTSIGQICIDDNALGDDLINDWKLRFEGELHYIRNQSISYDLIMISLSACYVFKKLLQN